MPRSALMWILVGSLAATLAACGDDGASSNEAGPEETGGADTTLAPDTTAESDAVQDADVDAAVDATPEPDGAEDAGTDAAPEPDAVEDAATDTTPEPDTVEDADADATPEPDTVEDTAPTEDVRTDADATPDAVPDAGPPIWTPPDRPTDYPFDAPASIATVLRFAPAGAGLSVDDDATPDNAVGAILGSLGGLLGLDVDGELQSSVESGLIAIGLGWVGDDPVSDSDRIEVHVLQLSDADANPATRDRYNVESESFIPGTGEPAARFEGETLAGQFSSGLSAFALTLPFGIFTLDARVESARIEGVVTRDALGVAVANGRIAGVVPGEDVFNGINAYASSSACTCLGLTEPLFVVGAEGAVTCTPPGPGACPSSDPCAQLASFCSAVGILVSGAYDQDLGGTPANDGLSVNFEFEAVGVTLVGFDP